MISLIVAKAENNVIGAKNDLPWHLSADLKHFKELTTGKTVVMGLNTYRSILGRLGHALPNRRNVVITNDDVTLDDVELIRSTDELKTLGDVFIIGGAMLYKTTIDIADRLYVTEVRANVDGDAYFPEIDKNVWHEVSREPHQKDDQNDHDYDFVLYQRSL